MAQSSKPTRPSEDALHLLKVDHHRVQKLFQKYEKTRSWLIQRRIAEHIFIELELHTQLEESVLYPAFELEADTEGERLIEDAQQDHQMMKDLIAELREVTDAEEFEARFYELRETVERHVAEEEHEMFPKAEEVLAEEMVGIRDEMQALKQLLLAS